MFDDNRVEMNALVSILIVTYNAERFIKKTIRSCLNQTYKNTEILILDNNSTDDTVGIIKEISDDRIHLYKSDENIGPYAGLNYLLDRANGAYVAIQDHDDIWFPDKLTQQVEFLNKNRDYIACGANTYYYFEDREIFISCRKAHDVDFVDHPSLIFRNEGRRYDPNHVFSDEHFERKILRVEGKIACLAEPLVIHRIKKDRSNLSSRRFTLSIKNIADLFRVNGYSFSSIAYLLHLVFDDLLSTSLRWYIRRFLTFRRCECFTHRKFMSMYPKIDV